MKKFTTPISFKELTLKNRIVMPPMCQYSAVDGFPTDWHTTHYISRAVGKVGAIIQEATAIVPEGRITYTDLGIWDDKFIEPLKKIVTEISAQGVIPGIQLAHAGRKASFGVLERSDVQLKEGVNSWQTYAPSAIPFNEEDKIPKELSKEEITELIVAFKKATERSMTAGYKIIEIHAAHGYLIHQFLSPLTNKRTDEYGGSFENRIRFLLEIVDAVSPLFNANHSLWVRISATDWVEGGWNIDESIELAKILKNKGVDLIDTSTGGIIADVKIPVARDYQVPFSERIKKETGILTGAVGLISDCDHAEELLSSDKADIILIGRALLREPYLVLNAIAKEQPDIIPSQYKRAYRV